MYDLHLALSAFFWVLCLIWYSRQREASVFHPITYYLAFHGLVFVVRPIVKQIYGYDSIYTLYQFVPDDAQRHLALLATNIGLVFFLFSCHVFGGVEMRFANPSIHREDRHPFILIVALLICSPLIYLSFQYVMSNNFGDEDLLRLARISATNAVLTDTTGYIIDANVMLGSLGVAIAWAYRFRPLAFIPLIVFLGLRMSVGRGRWTFIMMIASLILSMLYDKRAKWINLRSLVLAGMVFLTFNVLGQNRSAIADWITGRETTVAAEQNAKKDLFDGMDFANLEYLEYVIRTVPDLSGTFNYFANNLEVFTAPVPRILWPEKPVGPPVKFFELGDYGFPIGITTSVIGEGWQDLGLFGVAIWCALQGAFWGWIYRIFVYSKKSSFQVMYFVLFVPLCMQAFRDGILLSMLKFPLFIIAPVLLAQALSKIIRSSMKPEKGKTSRVRLSLKNVGSK